MSSGTYDATYNPSSQSVCGSLTLDGQSGWRLPTKKELITLVDYSIPYPGPTINTTYFPNTHANYYWSSTTLAYSADSAWDVYFGSGGVGHDGKSGDYYVRCVRGGQSGSLGTLTQNNCAASSDFKLHIPMVMLSGVSYWLDLQWNGSVFVVAGAGQN